MGWRCAGVTWNAAGCPPPETAQLKRVLMAQSGGYKDRIDICVIALQVRTRTKAHTTKPDLIVAVWIRVRVYDGE